MYSIGLLWELNYKQLIFLKDLCIQSVKYHRILFVVMCVCEYSCLECSFHAWPLTIKSQLKCLFLTPSDSFLYNCYSCSQYPKFLLSTNPNLVFLFSPLEWKVHEHRDTSFFFTTEFPSSNIVPRAKKVLHNYYHLNDELNECCPHIYQKPFSQGIICTKLMHNRQICLVYLVFF